MSVVTEPRGFIDFYHKPGSSNGAKVAVILNELGLTYRYHEIHNNPTSPIDKDTLRAISPNGLFPVITDIHPDGFKISLDQTGAIAQYLVNEYDREDHAISFAARLFFALEQRLKKTGDYLVGNKFSSADIAQIPFVVAAEEAGISIEIFPALTAWCKKVLLTE